MATMNSPLLSRRQAVNGGVLACLGASFLPRSWGAETPGAQRLITKTIPSSGEKLPVIGLGTDSFRASESAAIRDEIKRMHELGGSVIDTAAAYGDSEALIGDALATLGIPHGMFIATKLSADWGLGVNI